MTGSGFCCPAFLGALRHSLSIAAQAPSEPPPPSPACAALARAFLVHHTMALTLEPPVPAYLTEQPSDSPSLPLGDAQGVPTPGPSVAPPVLQPQQGANPNPIYPPVSQGRADGPGHLPPEGKKARVLVEMA
jgi:hypothetical protein